MRVIAVDEESPHLEAVKVLWRANSSTLGFLPEGAFVDYARERHILVVLSPAETCAGYLLYRVTKDRATIAHLCIADTARGQGYAKALVNHLVGSTGHLRGIGLRCRRDFAAYHIWPNLGFFAMKDAPGRAADGSELGYFWLDHNHADLFSESTDAGRLDVVIDANIVVDLAELRNEESQGLLADWLKDSIRLCVTKEHCNDFDRAADGTLRRKRKNEAAGYPSLDSSHADYLKAEAVLTPLFPRLTTPRDASDFRQLARALAGVAGAFVTRDQPILDRADDVYRVCGLPVVRPAELIGRIDELLREREYQRCQVAGTNQVFRERASPADGALIAAVKANDETKSKLWSILRPIFADPQRFACVTIRDQTEEVLAFYVLERKLSFDTVPVFRICSHRRAGTLARSILSGLTHQAARDGKAGVLIDEPRLNDSLRAACDDLGFLPVQAGRLKLVVSGVHTANALADRLDGFGLKEVGRISAVLRSPLDAATASDVEHLLWPAKIADAELPSFIVPIRPEFALDLFDEHLAKQWLFGADVDLALNPESVYYRSACQRILEYPGRILWYVSDKGELAGIKTIRACSRIAEVCIGKPKPLFKRFQRLGVYAWADVFKTARKDLERSIMAVRFHDTELLAPVAWDTFQEVLKRHNIRTNLESPARIPPVVFNEIYALAINSSALR